MIKEEFFKTFNIEPTKVKCSRNYVDSEDRYYLKNKITELESLNCPYELIPNQPYSGRITITYEMDKYPLITDNVFLNLICLLNCVSCDVHTEAYNIMDLKEYVLSACIDCVQMDYEEGDNLTQELVQKFYSNVRKLFGVQE